MSVTGVSCKVKFLRKRGYDNLEEWLSVPGHVMVTRAGRIFITDKSKPVGSDDRRRIFHYPKSLWANPYKVGPECSLSESLQLYQTHLAQLLLDPAMKAEFVKLQEKTEIACFCDEGSPCHRDVILDYLKSLSA
jgi:hypothetical protein